MVTYHCRVLASKYIRNAVYWQLLLGERKSGLFYVPISWVRFLGIRKRLNQNATGWNSGSNYVAWQTQFWNLLWCMVHWSCILIFPFCYWVDCPWIDILLTWDHISKYLNYYLLLKKKKINLRKILFFRNIVLSFY